MASYALSGQIVQRQFSGRVSAAGLVSKSWTATPFTTESKICCYRSLSYQPLSLDKLLFSNESLI